MRTLSEIIEATRNGDRPEYDELRYAVCALDALSTFDRLALSKLALAERESKPRHFVYSAEFQYSERFRRMKRALSVDPKTYVGWNNDPDNPEFRERRKKASDLVQRAMKDSA